LHDGGGELGKGGGAYVNRTGVNPPSRKSSTALRCLAIVKEHPPPVPRALRAITICRRNYRASCFYRITSRPAKSWP